MRVTQQKRARARSDSRLHSLPIERPSGIFPLSQWDRIKCLVAIVHGGKKGVVDRRAGHDVVLLSACTRQGHFDPFHHSWNPHEPLFWKINRVRSRHVCQYIVNEFRRRAGSVPEDCVVHKIVNLHVQVCKAGQTMGEMGEMVKILVLMYPNQTDEQYFANGMLKTYDRTNANGRSFTAVRTLGGG